jgi:hypothetical protein
MDIIKFGHGVQAVRKDALGVPYWEISDGQNTIRVTDGNAIRFAEALAGSEHVNVVDQNRTVRELCRTADGEKMLELFVFDARQLVARIIPKKPAGPIRPAT